MNFKRLIQGILLSFVFLLVLGTLALEARWFFENKDKNTEAEVFLGSVSDSIETGGVKTAPAPYRDWQVKDIEVLAQSAISVESNLLDEDKVLFKKDGDIKLPIASLTKLMTAMVALKNYDLTDKVTISQDAILQEGKKNVLKQQDVVSVKDLLYIMLIESSNQAAYALSEVKGEKNFVELMNQEAEKLGLKNTHFSDPTGLSSENYSTAEDLIELTEYLLKNYPIITEISRTKEIILYRDDNISYGKITNTNELLGKIPDIVGGKTGFTTDAKGCLILVLNNHQSGNYLIYVILGSDDRFGEMKKLINWVNSAYIWQ